MINIVAPRGTKRTTKYLQLTAKAKELFWKHGISRVSVDEICREAGVSKMTFYRYFKGKTAFAKVVLDQIFQEDIAKYHSIMSEPIPFEEKIKKTILLKFEGTKEISQELIKDIYGNEDSELKSFLEGRRQEMIKEVLNDYITAQKKGEIRRDIKPAFIMYFLNKMHEWGADDHLMALYDHPQEMIMELINLFFYGISNRPE